MMKNVDNRRLDAVTKVLDMPRSSNEVVTSYRTPSHQENSSTNVSSVVETI